MNAPDPHSPASGGPRRSDVRLLISLPAMVVVLVLALGTAYNLLLIDLIDRIEAVSTSAEARTEIARLTSAHLHDTLVILLIFSALAAVGGLALVWTVRRPIRQLATAVDNLAHGRPLKPVRLSGAYELDELGRSFNAMVDFVHNVIEEREDFLNMGLQTGSMIVEPGGRIVSINPTGLAILGVEREQLVGRNVHEVRNQSPEIAPTLLEFVQSHLNRYASATPVEVDLPARSEDENPLSVAYSHLHDEDRDAQEMIFHFRDVSQRETLDRLFSRTDQLAALGTFTLGLSHELRNPLGSLKGTAQLLREVVGDREDCAPYLERIVREVDRLDRLIRELYDFSRLPEDSQSILDLNELVAETLDHARRGLSDADQRHAHVVEEYAESLPRVVVQYERISRAISNVMINAFQHTPEGGKILVRTSLRPDTLHPRVLLDVVNSGPEIPEEVQEKIFEPFYSTRPGGTGLGLAIAYQSVIQNHGSLEVESEDDSTRFRFVFTRLADNGAIETT